MLSHLAKLLIVAVLLLGSTGVVAAQDTSPSPAPEAGTPARNLSLLQGLGFPEVSLVATDTDITGAPATLEAGRYLVMIENQTSDQLIQIDFIVPPVGTSHEQAWADLTSDSEEAPAWFYDSIWAGGPTAGGGQMDGVVVELAAGAWMLSVDRRSDSEVQPTPTYSTLEVTGELATFEEIPGAVPVDLSEYSFVFPETMTAGPQIWRLTNNGEQPHLMGLDMVPDGTTFNELMEFISFAFTGTPAASDLQDEDLHDVYSTPIISPGQSQWIEVDLDPGTYAVACFAPDQSNGAPHALMGMVQVFTAE